VSGIFGIIHLDGKPVDPRDLEQMRKTMAHRGPDGSDTWLDGPAGLGHLMLCSTPESLDETLPWKDPGSGLVITADARLDNREELFRKLNRLEIRQEPLQQISDSRLILAAYRRWGKACVDHLLGDFAFAVWNPGEKRLFCARDHMGLRPFYYYRSGEVFVFASSALGVVSASAVPGAISEQRIADHLFWELEGANKICTFFEEVRRLPPANVATLSHKEFSIGRYWQPDSEFELELPSDGEYTDAFEELLTDAVRVRMRCQTPTSSMLSGGLDSSTIVGIASKLQQARGSGPFSTFSGVSDDGEDCRETRYASKVIAQGGLDATLLHPLDVPDFEKSMRELDLRLEDPFEGGWILHKMIYLSARANGHRVVMDGVGGESTATLTSGYPAFLARSGHWLTAHRETLATWRHYHRKTIPLWWKYRDLARATLVPGFAQKLKRRYINPRLPWIDGNYVISEDYAERSGLRERLEQYRQYKGKGDCRTLRQVHVKQLDMSYLTAGTERYGRLAAVCGIENRQPLQDRRLVEFCVSLPWQQLVRNGWSKFGLRRVAERFLPHDVAWRTGWDEVMWKFWSALALRSPEIRARNLERKMSLLGQMVDQKKFALRSNRYMIGTRPVDESIVNLVFLTDWLENVIRSGKGEFDAGKIR
jgi:asparagine synthase (glutamine-hydrolysing)